MKYDEPYYMNGIDTGLSNYINYPKQVKFKTEILVTDLVREFKLGGLNVLDYGCAMGLHVTELRLRGVTAWGTDISDYAITIGKRKYCAYLDYYNKNLLTKKWDYVLFLDVLEHMGGEELISVLKLLKLGKTKKVIVKIPICAKEGGEFVFEASRNDVTHVMCKTKRWWKSLFRGFGYKKFTPINHTYLFDSEGVLAGVFS